VCRRAKKNGLGAIAVDGKMVDRPVYLLAQTVLDEAAAIEGGDAS
jgi:citrate lyase beta subunit